MNIGDVIENGGEGSAEVRLETARSNGTTSRVEVNNEIERKSTEKRMKGRRKKG